MKRKILIAIFIVAIIPAFLINAADDKKPNLGKIRISWSGGTCEAPIYVAYHKGFFKDEGLEPEFFQASFDQLKTGIATGKIDASVGNFSWFKSIEQGFKVKLVGGIHAGCISAVVPKDSSIKKVADFKGKTVGIESIGGGPQIILSIELRKAGIDPKTEVSWKVYPIDQLQLAAEKKEIDGFITWDPFPTKAINEKGFVTLLNIAKDEPYKSGYCCYIVVSADFLKKYPEKAAAYARAVLRAADWVGKNTKETSKIEVDNKYVATDVNENEKSLASYFWKPGIKAASDNIKFFISEQKKDGILDPGTDEKKLYATIWTQVISDDDLKKVIAKN